MRWRISTTFSKSFCFTPDDLCELFYRCWQQVPTSLLQSAAGLEALLPVPEFFDTFFSEVLGGERSVLGSAVLVVLVAPVTEEVVFRGMLLRGLSVRLGAGGAVFVSALLFALFHANPWQLGPSFLLGLLYGWWTVRTGSLWPAILGHALNNATGTLMFSILPGIEGSEALLEAADGTTAPWLAVLAALGLLVGLSGCVLLLRRDPPDRVADHLGGEAAARG